MVVMLATVVLRVAIVTAVVYLLLPLGPLCPHCTSEMVAIRNRFFDQLVPLLQRRWCLACGWNGVVRRARLVRGRRPRPAPRPASPPPPPRSPTLR